MSSAQQSTVEVDLLNVGFGPVGGENSASIPNKTRIAETVPSMFKRYIQTIIDESDTVKVEHGQFGERSEVQDLLDTVLETDDTEEYRQSSAALIQKLNDQMSGGNAAKGTLFISKSRVRGSTLPEGWTEVITLIKMDNMTDQRVFLDDNTMGEINQEDAFPPSGELQKGAIYPGQIVPPHTRRGNIKMYQKSYSDYFRYFFECEEILPSSLEQSRKVIQACDSVIEESQSRSFNSNDLSEIVAHAEEEEGDVTKDVLRAALQSISDDEIEDEEIDGIFDREDFQDLQIDADTFPEYDKATVETPDGKKITVKYPLGANSEVSIDQSGDTQSITVEGSRITHEYVKR